jgi:large subunit ribosomal protein L25
VSPAVKLHAGIISHVASELDVSCLPGNLPEFIEVDLAKLDVGQSIHLADLKLPNGVTAVTQENLTIATATVPAGQVSAEGGAAEGAEEAK